MSLCIKERHCPIFIVEEHTHNPGPLEEMQQLCLPCTCPVLTAPPQTYGPIAILWSQRDHSLSAHWLSSHTHIPRCFVSHVHLPVVPPCGETLCSKKKKGAAVRRGVVHTHKQTKNTTGGNIFRPNSYLPWWQGHMVRCQNARLSPPGSVVHLHPKPASHHPIKPTKGWLSWDPSGHQLLENDIEKRNTYFLSPNFSFFFVELIDGYMYNVNGFTVLNFIRDGTYGIFDYENCFYMIFIW